MKTTKATQIAIWVLSLLALLAGVLLQLRGDASGTGWVLVLVGIALAGGTSAWTRRGRS